MSALPASPNSPTLIELDRFRFDKLPYWTRELQCDACRLLVGALLGYCRDKDYCWPSIKRMQTDLGWQRRKIFRHLAHLKVAGILGSRRHRNAPSTLTVRVPQVSQTAPQEVSSSALAYIRTEAIGIEVPGAIAQEGEMDKVLRKTKGGAPREREQTPAAGALRAGSVARQKEGPARELLYWFSAQFKIALHKKDGQLLAKDVSAAMQLIETYGDGVQLICRRAWKVRNEEMMTFDGPRFTIHKVVRYAEKCDTSLDDALKYSDDALRAMPTSSIHKFTHDIDLLRTFVILHKMTREEVEAELEDIFSEQLFG